MDFKLSHLQEEERQLYIALVLMNEDLTAARQLIKSGQGLERALTVLRSGLDYVPELETAMRRCAAKEAMKL